MFFEWLKLRDVADEPALIAASGQQSWLEFRDALQTQTSQLQSFRGQRVGLLLAPNSQAILQLFSLASVGAHLFLVAFDAATDDLDEWATDFGWSAIFDHSGPARDFGASPSATSHSEAVTILTSGTTGKPKAVEHTWESLTRPVRKTPPGQTWLLTYRPHLYAGLQVTLQCLLNHGCLVMPAPGESAEDVASLAAKAEVEFASATPSYWRWLLTLADAKTLKRIPLRQITLGGEAVDQPTLDGLRRQFPQTRLVHIYATTELGRCFSVTDGKAGFPVAYLDAPSKEGVQITIEDEELVVRSANAMSGYDRLRVEGLEESSDSKPTLLSRETVSERGSSKSPLPSGEGVRERGSTSSKSHSPRDAWFHTSDLVRVEGDRVYFVGRKSDMINVGGNKVYPLEVENVVRSVEGVADARIYGEASSIVGQLVRCDLVVADGYEPAAVEQAVRAKSLEMLNSHQRPRLISIVAEIPRTTAGKTKRDSLNKNAAK